MTSEPTPAPPTAPSGIYATCPLWIHVTENYTPLLPGYTPASDDPPLVWEYLMHARMDAAKRLKVPYLTSVLYWHPSPKREPPQKLFPPYLAFRGGMFQAHAKTMFHCGGKADNSWAQGVSITTFRRMLGGSGGPWVVYEPCQGERPDSPPLDSRRLAATYDAIKRRDRDRAVAITRRIGPPVWYSYLSGRIARPRADKLEQIAGALHLTPDQLCCIPTSVRFHDASTLPYCVGTENGEYGDKRAWPMKVLDTPTTMPERLELELAWGSGSPQDAAEAIEKIKKKYHVEKKKVADWPLREEYIVPTKREQYDAAVAEVISMGKSNAAGDRYDREFDEGQAAILREARWEVLTGIKPKPLSITVAALAEKEKYERDRN